MRWVVRYNPFSKAAARGERPARRPPLLLVTQRIWRGAARAVEGFHRVGCVDDLADGSEVVEKPGQPPPVAPPTFGQRIRFLPFGRKLGPLLLGPLRLEAAVPVAGHLDFHWAVGGFDRLGLAALAPVGPVLRRVGLHLPRQSRVEQALQKRGQHPVFARQLLAVRRAVAPSKRAIASWRKAV